MADDGKFVVEIELDDGSVKKGFANIETEGGNTFKRIGEVAAGVFAGEILVKAFDRIAGAAKDFMADAIRGAADAQVNINRLNNAMAMAGTFSEAASEKFQKFADEMQRTTTIEDDAVIGLLALARNLTKSNEQAQGLTQAAINLGAALGTGPEAALQQLNMTLDGHAGRLAKRIPELANFSEAQLKAGAAIEFVNQRFKGAAANELNTYAGALTQLGHIWGNLKETIGNYIVSSQAVIVTIRHISEAVVKMTQAIQASFGSKDIFKDLLINLSVILQASIETGRRIGLSFELAFLRAQQAWTAFKVLTTMGLSNAFNQQLQDVLTKIEQVKGEFSKDSAATQFFDGLIEKLQATNGELAKMTGVGAGGNSATSPLKQLKSDVEQLSGPVDSLGQSFNNFMLGFEDAAYTFAANAKSQFQDAGTAAFKGLSAGVSSGMAAIGKALIKGENIFQAFAGAMLGALGQAAMQMGATYMLMGLARAFSSYGMDPTAQGLIGTGTALSVLGGALMAVGDGISGGPSAPSAFSGAGGGSYVGGGFVPDGNDAAEIEEKNDQRVVVNIQGDVLDSRDTGMRIIEIINEAGFGSGGKVFA